MEEIAARRARDEWADVLNQVEFHHDRVRLTRRGKPVAAVVTVEDLELLERLEDEADMLAVRESIAKADKEGPPVPWAEVKKQLRL